MRCHCMQNVQTALDFLKRKGVSTVQYYSTVFEYSTVFVMAAPAAVLPELAILFAAAI